MKKILFLTNGKNDMVKSKEYGNGIYAYPVYKYNSKIYKIFIKAIRKVHCDIILKYVLGRWARKIENYDIVVCEGLKGKKWVFEYLLKYKRNDAKIIMWHWNKIFKNEIAPSDTIAQQCEQWSFDPDDCEKYHLKFNTQYFSKINLNENLEKKWDVYFLGTDKNRTEKLLKLEEIFKLLGKKTNFHVVKSSLDKANPRITYKKNISYKENLENVIQSNIVLDIPISGQRGLTLRVLESLYYRRKLISFNDYLKNELFYNDNNILILNERDLDSNIAINKIEEFLNKPYQDLKENELARKYFSFVEWILRFGNG